MFEDHYAACYRSKLREKYNAVKSHPDYVAPKRIPQVCDICGKALSSKQALVKHRMLHTDERPFKCDYPNCGEAYTQSVQLKK
jgi:uncharacterized Zn-finger protein